MGILRHSYFRAVISKAALFLFLIISPLVHANETQENTREFCQQLIDEARQKTSNKNYPEALELLLKAELMASQNQWDDKLWIVKHQIGVIYAYISNFGEALDYFQESYLITQKGKTLHEHSSVPLSSIGVLYVSEKKYEEALHYMLRAYDNIKETGLDYSFQKHTVSNIAGIYSKLNKPHKSLEILFEAEGSCGNTYVDFRWQVVYIDALFKSGEVSKAQAMGEQLYVELSDGTYTDYREECYTCLVMLLSDIYTEIRETDLAIEFAKKGLRSSDELIDHIELYENISNLYLRKDEYKTALQYKDSVLKAKDSLSSLMNRNLYEVNKVKFKIQDYQNEIKRQQSQRKFLIAVIIFSLFLSFLIYKGLRNKVIKQKQKAVIANLELEKEKKEHLLAEKELETTKLKQQQLKHEVAEKNRELFAKAIYLSNRNELIQDIIGSLETNDKVVENKETAKQIKIIKNFLKTDNQRDDFVKHFESVNPDFLRRLKEKHPRLSSNDTRFLCYVFMNLSLKEISMVFSITYNACIIRKQRIMDKMGLDKKGVSLYDYLLTISD